MVDVLVQFDELIENCDELCISANNGREVRIVNTELIEAEEVNDGLTIDINADGCRTNMFYFNYELSDREVNHNPEGKVIGLVFHPKETDRIEFLNSNYLC